MEKPLRLDVHGTGLPAQVRDLIDKNFAKFEKRFGRVTDCHIVIRSPLPHSDSGNPWLVTIRIALAEGSEVYAGRSPGRDIRFADPEFAVSDAFRRATYQLMYHVRSLRKRPVQRGKTVTSYT